MNKCNNSLVLCRGKCEISDQLLSVICSLLIRCCWGVSGYVHVMVQVVVVHTGKISCGKNAFSMKDENTCVTILELKVISCIVLDKFSGVLTFLRARRC